jgi:hypothetical protein
MIGEPDTAVEGLNVWLGSEMHRYDAREQSPRYPEAPEMTTGNEGD